MNAFTHHLEQSLKSIREQNLYRDLRQIEGPQTVRLRYQGRTCLAFASNDYLGLATHPKVCQAAQDAITHYGAGAGASRLISGSLPPHQHLEGDLAAFKGTEAAISFSSGYQAALGVFGALLSKDDVVFSDQLNHACLIDGIRLSRARTEVFQHNDLDHLEHLLKQQADLRTKNKHPRSHSLIVTESVFSMDGHHAPLPDLVKLKNQYDAWLMVDEAHATGLYGPRRSGLADAFQLAHEVDIQMGTLGKALGSAGGFITGTKALREVLINRARTLIFSTAPCPAAAAAASAALKIVQSPEGQDRVKTLWQRIQQLRDGLGLSSGPLSPIVPFHIGDEAESVRIAQALQQRGFVVPAVRYPSVPHNQARLRITVSSSHTPDDIASLVTELQDVSSK